MRRNKNKTSEPCKSERERKWTERCRSYHSKARVKRVDDESENSGCSWNDWQSAKCCLKEQEEEKEDWGWEPDYMCTVSPIIHDQKTHVYVLAQTLLQNFTSTSTL